ncbi:MAG: DedA family protein [Parachlamydiales bacterium]|nr:DedA family protein [Parachlamydiales bacterium]
MNTIIEFIFLHAPHAHWIIFGALMLAGLNIPISEDLLIIIGAVIASTILPQNTIKIFLAIFLGAYISDSVVYWLARGVGNLEWFRKLFPQKKLHKAHRFYDRHGFYTLLIGRFIPFGIRNCLFATAGMGKMNYGKFLLSDGIACLLSNSLLFFTTFALGKNYEAIFRYLKRIDFCLFIAFIIGLFVLIWYSKKKRKRKISLEKKIDF